jgi:hypothetical protein
MSRHYRIICAVALTVFTTSHFAVLGAQSTPTAAMKVYYEAGRKKDFTAFKRIVSSAYLKQLAKAPVAPEQIMETLAQHLPPSLPASRNEKIAADRATLEVYNDETKQWETLHFVREDGVWKVALEKMR